MKSPFAIPAAILFGGLLVAGAVYLSLREPARAPGTGDPALVRPVTSADHIFGNPAARVLIVEYADFDCTFCGAFSETLRQIVANEGAGGEVAWIFREFPLVEIHPNAFSHARAAECAALAGGESAFWAFTDALFAHQPVDPAAYGTIAAAAGLSGESFAACLAGESSAIDARINADRANALLIGAEGAPYTLIIVDGRVSAVMDGAYPYDAVKRLVDEAIYSSTSPSR